MVKTGVAKVQTVEGLWELPTEWEWVPLGEMCDVAIGGTPSRSNPNYWGTGHTWVSIADLNGGIVTDSKEQITNLGVKNSNVKEVEPGTVLMSFKLTIGKIGIAGKKLYTNEAIAALPIKSTWKTNLENYFLFYALQTVPLSGEADLAVKGKTLNKQKLARILLPIPFPNDPFKSYNIQRRIVARIEALLAEVRRARTLLEQMRYDASRLIYAALQEVFPRSEKALPQGWCVKTIEDIKPIDRSPVQTGPFGAQLKSEEFVDMGIPVVAIGNVQWGKLNTNQLNYVTPVKDKQLSRYKLRTGDILFTRMGTVGRSCVVPTFADGWLMTYHLIRVSVNPEKAMPEFVFYCFRGANTVANQIREKGRGATREGVNSQILRELRLPLPQLKQQKQIVAYLNSIQGGIDEMQQSLDQKNKLIDQLEQSILQQEFRGDL